MCYSAQITVAYQKLVRMTGATLALREFAVLALPLSRERGSKDVAAIRLNTGRWVERGACEHSDRQAPKCRQEESYLLFCRLFVTWLSMPRQAKGAEQIAITPETSIPSYIQGVSLGVPFEGAHKCGRMKPKSTTIRRDTAKTTALPSPGVNFIVIVIAIRMKQ